MSLPKEWINAPHVVGMTAALSGFMTLADGGTSMFVASVISLLSHKLLYPKLKIKEETKVILSTSTGLLAGLVSLFLSQTKETNPTMWVKNFDSPFFIVPLILFLNYAGHILKDPAFSSIVYSLMASVTVGGLMGGQVGLMAVVSALVSYFVMKFLVKMNAGKKETYFHFISTVFGLAAGITAKLAISVVEYQAELNTGSYIAGGFLVVLWVLYKMNLLPFGWNTIFEMENKIMNK